ncbi:MAG: type II toxin-antitoxin system PemK/MazF family toxin [Candidatus Paceibacterota bacterium]|jgi:mRNA interferase MazF
MKKDFSKWFKEKTEVYNEKTRPFFRNGEVWFTALGENIGFEQDGRGENYLRPVVIIRKFNNEVFWAIPLTKNKKNGKFYFSFILVGETSTAILSQIRLVDAKRLFYRLGIMRAEDLAEMKKRLKALLP